jgi:ABC-type oligopeptide transport system substrate-binding subunit
MERNPHYTGRFTGNLGAIELDLAKTHENFLERYAANELDFVGLNTDTVERMRYRYPGEYLSSPTLGLSFIGFNQAYPPLNDVRVRRALVHATDRQTLVETLALGYPCGQRLRHRHTRHHRILPGLQPCAGVICRPGWLPWW